MQLGYYTQRVGETVSTTVVEYPKDQDVVDLVLYRWINGELQIGTQANVRPGVLVFHHLCQAKIIQNSTAPISHTNFTELPAGIIRSDLGESSPRDTLPRLLSEKFGITLREVQKISHTG